MVQRAALAVAEDPRKGEEPRLASGEQLLGGEFRRGVQIESGPARVGGDELGRERVQVRLVAGRDLQDRGLGLDEVAGGEPSQERRRDARTRQQKRPPVGINVARPPWRRGHKALSRQAKSSARKYWRRHAISVCCAPTVRGVQPKIWRPQTTEEST